MYSEELLFTYKTNKEASRLYAELLLCVCWHTEHIWIGPFDIKLLNIVILSSRSDLSNLWLHIFCSIYGFFSFVLSLISTVCELFFTKEVPCFTLQDIFISGEVLVLAFWSDLSNLWLDIFCSRYGFFFHLFCLWFQLFVNYSLLKKCLVSHCKIFSFLVKYWY